MKGTTTIRIIVAVIKRITQNAKDSTKHDADLLITLICIHFTPKSAREILQMQLFWVNPLQPHVKNAAHHTVVTVVTKIGLLLLGLSISLLSTGIKEIKDYYCMKERGCGVRTLCILEDFAFLSKC